MKKLFKREKYLSKIRGFYFENDLIKVVTGIRRCGKSSLMEIISDELVEKGVDKNNIEWYIMLLLKIYIKDLELNLKRLK